MLHHHNECSADRIGDDVLEEIFSRVGTAEEGLLVSALGRRWRAWAAARWMEREAACGPAFKQRPLPLCFVRDAWPRMAPHERRAVAQRAAFAGQLSVLRFAAAAGCPLDATICEEAARGGHVDVLRAVRSAGCPWDRRTCRAAVMGDHIGALQYALANGCERDSGACLLAAELGNVEALRALRARGCPWDRDLCRYHADQRSHDGVVDFIDCQR
jgi:hypothetical protein